MDLNRLYRLKWIGRLVFWWPLLGTLLAILYLVAFLSLAARK